MNKIKKYRAGISTAVDYTVPIEKIIPEIAQNDFEFVSLGADPTHTGFYDPMLFKQTRDMCREFGIEITSAHIPFGKNFDIASDELSIRQTTVIEICRFLELAADYEIPMAILHPHHYFTGSKEAHLSRILNGLDLLIASVPDNIKIAIENLPRSDGSWICCRLLEKYGPDKFGFCFDSSHENISGPPFHILEKYYNRITLTHLSDNNGQSDEHLIPGDGNINWPALRAFLDCNKRLSDILFEVGTGDRLDEPHNLFIQRAALAFKRYFG